MTTQIEQLKIASKHILGEHVTLSNTTESGLYLPGKQKPTKIWKVLKVGPGLTLFPDLKPGEHVVPERHHFTRLDNRLLSFIYENEIFGVTPTMTAQVAGLRLQEKFLLAEQIQVKTSELLHMPPEVSTLWRVVKIGAKFEKFELSPGDSIVLQKHAKVTLDLKEYAMIHEDWIFGALPPQ